MAFLERLWPPKKFFSSNSANELSNQGRSSTKTQPQSKSTKTYYEPGDDDLFTRIENTSETFNGESLCSDGTENDDDTNLDSGEQKENEYVPATATTENSVFTLIANISPPLYNQLHTANPPFTNLQ